MLWVCHRSLQAGKTLLVLDFRLMGDSEVWGLGSLVECLQIIIS